MSLSEKDRAPIERVEAVANSISDVAQKDTAEYRGITDKIALLNQASDDLYEAAESFSALLQAAREEASGAGEPVAWPISVDGPNKITDQRAWLARQLLDSKLTDGEAFGIVAYHPDIRSASTSPPNPQEGAGEPVAEDVAAYNERFDAADEAGQEIYNEAFWHGWMWARDPNFEDEEGMREEFNRGIDGVVLGEGWEGCRDAFLKRLPLVAVDASPPPANDRTKALEEALKALVRAAEKTPRAHAPPELFAALSEANEVLRRAALNPSDQPVKGDDHEQS